MSIFWKPNQIGHSNYWRTTSSIKFGGMNYSRIGSLLNHIDRLISYESINLCLTKILLSFPINSLKLLPFNVRPISYEPINPYLMKALLGFPMIQSTSPSSFPKVGSISYETVNPCLTKILLGHLINWPKLIPSKAHYDICFVKDVL